MNLLSLFMFHLFLVVRRGVYLSLYLYDMVFSKNRQTIIIISYHSVCKDQWRFSIDPAVIKKQIEYLADHFTIISLKDVSDFLRGVKRIVFPAVVLTFDDGYKDILDIKEFLQKKHIIPTLFILSDTTHANWKELGSQRPFLSHNETLSLTRHGWELGVHSATHTNLVTINQKELEVEILHSKKILEKKLRIPLPYFAYPRGKYSSAVVKTVKKAQYHLALTMDDGFINTKTEKLLIPRIGIDRTHSFHEFKAAFSPSVISVRRFIKSTFIGSYL